VISFGQDAIGSGQEQVAGSREHGNEPFDSVKEGNFVTS
jgi:hypothetical protein